jgi:peptidoglycan hydrolase-like protein with peptidoglycan-binding domain
MNRSIIANSVLVAALAAGTGCGHTTQDRAVSGAGIGAGAGAIIGAVTGLSVLEGAVLGALGGSLTGALTDSSQVNMGEPAWKTSQRSAPAAPHTAQPAPQDMQRAIADLQARLAARGYYPGPVDGVVGAQTRAAIRAYQKDRGLPVDGQITQALVASLNS